MVDATIEEQELDARLQRAAKTLFSIKILDNEHFPFSCYEVVSDSKRTYEVEIRCLHEKINSCSCPDFYVNTLGTCKHIEGVLNLIKKAGKRKWTHFTRTGSKRVEIFLKPSSSEVQFTWPESLEGIEEIHACLSEYISASGTLLAEPMIAIPSIQNALKKIDGVMSAKVRISFHLLSWVAECQQIRAREHDRDLFLEDVKSGKRSFHMLACKLFPYQEEGMLHLAFKGKAILADEMGLGKTIQAIAACELLRKLNRVKRVLVVTPASLKGEWEEQIHRFLGLPTLLVNGSRAQRLASYKKEAFFYLVNYEQVRIDYDEIQHLLCPDILILDEAQRIKNWETKTAWAIKQVKTPYAFVLTGTPIENRIDELYSLMQVVDPKILGPLFKFNQDFYKIDAKGKLSGYKNLNELHRRLDAVVLRRRKKDVEEQLPERTLKQYFIKMGPEQTLRYEELSGQVASLLRVLKKRLFTPEESKKLQRLLACMRMVADTPYILDEECRECPKLEELEEILKGLMDEGNHKVIIFSEWERMLFLVRELADRLGLDYGWHTGSVPQDKRREDIRRFKESTQCKLFLSTDSGSVGLNLQVADVVINLDLPWNPAKLEQRIARAWRKNQTRTVQVINLVAENTIEQRMLSTLVMKQAVADIVLDAALEMEEVPLPSASSRQELIDSLENLMGCPLQDFSKEAIIEEPETKTLESMTQELLARYGDRIHSIEKRQGSILIVVDTVDAALKEKCSTIFADPIEILDFETYTVLQRLAQSGFIHFNKERDSVIFQSNLIQNCQNGYKQEQLQTATTLYKEAERQLKMSSLLKSGGFILESLPSAREALDKCLNVYKVLDRAVDDTGLRLKDEQGFPENTEIFVDKLSSWMQEVSLLLTQFTLGIVAP